MIQSFNSRFKTSAYPTLQDASYNQQGVNRTPFSVDESGIFWLSPGDYSIPVMTYCMRSESASPEGHVYTLDQMQGTLAPIIKKLNLLAPYHFSLSDIQILIWSLQNGLSYQEMTKESQAIVDQIIPEYRDHFKESFLQSLEKKVDHLVELSDGSIPALSELSYLREMRRFRKKLREVGNDYAELSHLIDTTSRQKRTHDIPWSIISENIYARFVTKGSFAAIGFLQVKVMTETGRTINTEVAKKYPLDVISLIANPNDSNIQPLSFTPLYGMAGIVASSKIVSNPHAAALLIALALTVYPMNWDDFFKLEELLEDADDKNLQKKIEEGKGTLRKEHDELEKPLKEERIITGKTKNASTKKNRQVRQYTKPGGIEQLETDFEKIKGEFSKIGDFDLKTLPDGTKVLKRPLGSEHGPTLEVQPPKGDPRFPDDGIRIKVRYL